MQFSKNIRVDSTQLYKKLPLCWEAALCSTIHLNCASLSHLWAYPTLREDDVWVSRGTPTERRVYSYK
ncbi:hypothetical protein JYQ62_10145 [Nostoc sp. UHCC 0702]|nr:hypothetical protein JYQ62_10145 [Nostoc sp. UHCC 0702]